MDLVFPINSVLELAFFGPMLFKSQNNLCLDIPPGTQGIILGRYCAALMIAVSIATTYAYFTSSREAKRAAAMPAMAYHLALPVITGHGLWSGAQVCDGGFDVRVPMVIHTVMGLWFVAWWVVTAGDSKASHSQSKKK